MQVCYRAWARAVWGIDHLFFVGRLSHQSGTYSRRLKGLQKSTEDWALGIWNCMHTLSPRSSVKLFVDPDPPQEIQIEAGAFGATSTRSGDTGAAADSGQAPAPTLEVMGRHDGTRPDTGAIGLQEGTTLTICCCRPFAGRCLMDSCSKSAGAHAGGNRSEETRSKMTGWTKRSSNAETTNSRTMTMGRPVEWLEAQQQRKSAVRRLDVKRSVSRYGAGAHTREDWFASFEARVPAWERDDL